MLLPLLATKLNIPPLRHERVSRPRLIARLHRGFAGPLTLVAAPAGFGKTTLLSDAVRLSQISVAWLTLEADDADPIRFARYLLAAIQRVIPQLGMTATSLLDSPQPPALETVISLLINDLAAHVADVVLVLDDYHVLESPVIDSALRFLLDHLPPTLHLVIGTREDPPLPLTRLRARGQLTELRAADLRFSVTEARTFLHSVMGTELTPEQATALAERTEGWAAGLQLAALALHEHEDAALFVADLRATHRYILDYLVDEVLQHQPADVQMFLLTTSIVDRLCVPLCDTLLESATSSADAVTPVSSRQMLQQLERANLFLIPLDAERRWYRYHTLFADVLRSRLQALHPDLVPLLHRRAASWFTTQAADDLLFSTTAIRHALAASDYDLVARVIEQYGGALLGQGAHQQLGEWLAELPETFIRRRPQLCIAQSWLRNLAGQPALAEARLHDAEQALTARGNAAPPELVAHVRGHAATIRAYAAQQRGELAEAMLSGQTALEWLPPADATCTSAHLIVGVSAMDSNHLLVAQEHLEQAIALGQASGNHHAALAATGLLGELFIIQGRLQAAAAHYRQAIAEQQGAGGQPRPIAGDLYVGLGRLLHEWNELDAAADHLAQGRTLSEQVANWWTTRRASLALAWTRHAQGDVEAADALLDQIDVEAGNRQDVVARDEVQALRARLHLAQGNLPAVAAWLEQAMQPHNAPMDEVRATVTPMLARGFIALNQPVQALALLAPHITAAEAAGRQSNLLVLLILRALAEQAHGAAVNATTTLTRALTIAAPAGYVRSFVDEGAGMKELLTLTLRGSPASAPLRPSIQRLLDAFPHDIGIDRGAASRSPATPALPEPLTPRELELLQFIAAGRSNQEIADRLVITVGTVKWYLNHLYAKLDVRGRMQAVARARELGVIN